MGVKEPCFIGHGKSAAKAVKNALIAAANYAQNKVNQKIAEEIKKFEQINI